ncbi:DUF927 domain-containing protein [Streptomyces sp. NPDC001520]|uniref:DUF927 domain-containing protein n=1 Tax=Streptomyces sp. NPDC001520 TaxID=3364581 RepID=UPI0036795020
MKSGWFFRPADRSILHRAKEGATALPIGSVPVVLGRVTYRMADRRHTRVGYQLQSTEGPRIATAEQVLDGTWADLLGHDRPSSADERHAYARILSEDLRGAPEVPAMPVKDRDGTLHLPAADAQELGYLRTGDPDEAAAREAWRRALTLATDSERTTLALGAMFCGPLVSSLPGVPAHVLNLQGDGQQGKSTTQLVQAAMMGDPSDAYEIFGSMNSTGLALPETLIEARYLPMVREETSSSAMSLADVEKLFSRIVAGAKRARLGQGGARKQGAGSWHSVFVTSSNETLLRPGQVEALASRLIQLHTPFWGEADAGGAAAAMEAVERTRQFHGWPLVWADRAGLFAAERVADWRALHGEITGRLTTAGGGVPLTLARILAAWCVGGYMLGEVLGMPVIGERAIEDAHAELPRILGDVVETHLSPGQVLWEAVAGAIASEPASWVEPRQLTGEQGPASSMLYEPLKPRRVLGYLYEGRVHAYVSTVKEAAKSAGLDSPVPGLHELRRRGVLLTEERTKLASKHPTRELRAAVPGRVYVLDVEAAQAAFADRETPPGVVPEALAPPADGGATTAAEERAAAAALAPLPASLGAPDSAGTGGADSRAGQPLGAPDSAGGTLGVESGVGAFPEPVRRVVYPAWDRLSDAGGRTASAARVGVLAADGLHLPNCAPVEVGLPATVDAVPALMDAYGLRTLYLHGDVLPLLGLPEYDPMKEGGPQAPAPCAWATPGSSVQTMQPEAGVSCWMTLTTAKGRLSLAIPAYEDRIDKTPDERGGFGGAPDGATLLDALMVYTLSTWHGPRKAPRVVPYYLSPNKTAEDYAGGLERTDVVCEAIRAGEVAAVRTPMMVNPQWKREPGLITDAERSAAWLHQYDKSAAWLAVFGSAKLGVGEPVRAREGAAYSSALAGYWRVAEVPGTGPAGLPDFRFYPADAGGYWLRSPSVDLLAEVYPDWEPRVLEAWFWPTTKRALEGFYKVAHASRGRILEQAAAGAAGARYAKQVNGRLYQSFRGYLARQEPKRDRVTGEVYARDIYWRPDWAETLLDLAVANTYRNLKRFADADGRYPLSLYVDAATYADSSADPEAAKPASMRLGNGGGCWTPEGSAPMADVLPRLDDGESAHAVLRDYLTRKEG